MQELAVFVYFCICVCPEVCIRFCTNAAKYPRGRQMAERIEPVSLREEPSLYSHTCMSVYAPSSAISQSITIYRPVTLLHIGFNCSQQWSYMNHMNVPNITQSLQLNFVSNPVFTHCSATKPLLFSSWALIELRLNCGSCHCCLLLWKVTCCSSPLTSFRDERRSPENCVCVCYRLCPFICVCVCQDKAWSLCVLWSRTQQ